VAGIHDTLVVRADGTDGTFLLGTEAGWLTDVRHRGRLLSVTGGRG
jgi:hypothetical protein